MLADFYKKNNDLENAENFLNKSLVISQEIGDTVSIVSALNFLAELNFLKEKYLPAKNFAKDAFNLAEKKDLPKHISEAAKYLSQISSKLKDFNSAYNFLKIHKEIEDSLLSIEKIKAFEDIQAKYKLEQLETEKLRIENQALVSKTQIQNRNLLILILIILIIISLFTLGTFFYRKRKERKIENENASKLTKKIDLLSSQLNTKNRELTSKALMISSNNKTFHEIVTEIDEFLNDESNDKKKIRQLKNKLQSISEEESWNDFLQHFEEVHPEFYKKITEKFSSLSSSEQKICAFLKMNLNTKEIAQITNQTTKSVEVARTRIRKKLGIDHNESLTQAIHNL
jgi:DNA-binding CsgD family transcriptional regulator